MASRDQFLGTVREAVARGRSSAGRGQETPLAWPLLPLLGEIAQGALEVKERLATGRGETLALLEKMAPLQGWQLTRVSSPDEASRVIGELALRLKARLLVHSNDPILERVFATSLTGVEMLAGGDRDAAAKADLGVTGAEYVIAETATAVLVPAKGTGRLTSLLPPVHVAVAEAAQVVETLEDALALYQQETQQKGWTANSAYLISGPSRTGDIEQTIVVGVHGPREVHLVLIGP